MNVSIVEFFIFSDASFDSRLGMGAGAFLILTERELLHLKRLGELSITTTILPSKSIARLELSTVLWALDTLREHHAAALDAGKLEARARVSLFTDCKNIANLNERRSRLEVNHFKSKRQGTNLVNADLYKKFFQICDRLHPTVIWIKGHHPTQGRDEFQKLFSQVDKAARRRLREYRRISSKERVTTVPFEPDGK